MGLTVPYTGTSGAGGKGGGGGGGGIFVSRRSPNDPCNLCTY